MPRYLFIVAFLILICPGGAQGTSSFPDPGIRGLKAICVSVQSIDELPSSTTELRIEAQAISRLEKAHVPVVSSDDCEKTHQHAYLELWLKASKSASGRLYAYEVEIELRQEVRLERDPTIQLEMAPTWHNWKLGLADAAKLESVLNSSAMGLVEMFARMFQDESQRR